MKCQSHSLSDTLHLTRPHLLILLIGSKSVAPWSLGIQICEPMGAVLTQSSTPLRSHLVYPHLVHRISISLPFSAGSQPSLSKPLSTAVPGVIPRALFPDDLCFFFTFWKCGFALQIRVPNQMSFLRSHSSCFLRQDLEADYFSVLFWFWFSTIYCRCTNSL